MGNYVLFLIAKIIIVSIVYVFAAENDSDIERILIEYEWVNFQIKFGKKYQNKAEHDLGRKNYLHNRYVISNHNHAYYHHYFPQGYKPTFKLGLHKYGMLSKFYNAFFFLI